VRGYSLCHSPGNPGKPKYTPELYSVFHDTVKMINSGGSW